MKGMHLLGPAPYYTNCYMLISDAGSAVVIDPAAPVKAVQEILEKENAKLTHILLTHGHMDHVYSLKELRELYHPKLCMCVEDALGTPEFSPTDPEICFEDGDVLKVDEMEFKVWRTPGHTPGSCCILCEDLFFTGDTLFNMSIGRTDLWGGDMNAMRKTLCRLKTLPVPARAQVLPGHMDFSTFGYECENNPYLRSL